MTLSDEVSTAIRELVDVPAGADGARLVAGRVVLTPTGGDAVVDVGLPLR